MTFNVISFEDKKITFNTSFNHPRHLSQCSTPDYLSIKLLDEYFAKEPEANLTDRNSTDGRRLSTRAYNSTLNYTEMKVPLPQMIGSLTQTETIDGLVTFLTDTVKVLFFVMLAVSCILTRNRYDWRRWAYLKWIWPMMCTLQIILVLPMALVNAPTNVLIIAEQLSDFVNFNVFTAEQREEIRLKLFNEVKSIEKLQDERYMSIYA